MRTFLAEMIGTFTMVLVGTGAIVLDNAYPGYIGNLGIAISFGAIVTAMIYAFGKSSGAHINPAVSIAFSITHLFDKKKLLNYIPAQIIGALSASLLLRLLFPADETLGSSLPAGSWQESFILEFFLTFGLMLVILWVSQHKKWSHLIAISAGTVVGLEAYFAGPTCGASMNPARSIGPAIVSGHTEHLWAYIVSTILGAVLATILWLFFQQKRVNF